MPICARSIGAGGATKVGPAGFGVFGVLQDEMRTPPLRALPRKVVSARDPRKGRCPQNTTAALRTRQKHLSTGALRVFSHPFRELSVHGDRRETHLTGACQPARNRHPGSACKRDPFEGAFLRCFFVRRRGVSPSRLASAQATRAAAVNTGRRPPRQWREAVLRAASTARSWSKSGCSDAACFRRGF